MSTPTARRRRLMALLVLPFLLVRLGVVMSGRRAALAAGACHALFHLPLLTLTTTYQSAGNRWIVVPMVMATLTSATSGRSAVLGSR